MKDESKPRTIWLFVDESGDPVFFNRRGHNIVGQEGCSRILQLGFVEMAAPRPVRKALAELRQRLLGDSYLRSIPSMVKTARAFHAKDDCPEVRKAVFELIVQQDFKFTCVVARKSLSWSADEFMLLHNGRQGSFYDGLVSRLFEEVYHQLQLGLACSDVNLEIARRGGVPENVGLHCQKMNVYFAKRGDRPRQSPLVDAIRRGLRIGCEGEPKVELAVQCQTPSDEPCLQITDYILWAVQRAFLREETRYLDYVWDKIELVWDIDGKWGRDDCNRYGPKWNSFSVNKIGPL